MTQTLKNSDTSSDEPAGYRCNCSCEGDPATPIVSTEETLDPEDWEVFRSLSHNAVAMMILTCFWLTRIESLAASKQLWASRSHPRNLRTPPPLSESKMSAIDEMLSPERMELKKRARSSFEELRAIYGGVRPSQRAHAASEDVQSTLRELGYYGFLSSRDNESTTRGLVDSAVVVEELAAQGLHSFGPILAAMACAAIARYGFSDPLRHALFRMVEGKSNVAIASTEAEAGFNVLNISTSCTKSGDTLHVNGSKAYISGADVSDLMVLVARSMTIEERESHSLPRSAGITVLLVERSTPGIELTPLPTRGEGVLSQFSVRLTDVRVPTTNVVGEINKGVDVLFEMFNAERVLCAAMCIGIARYCLELACTHARSRCVFGATPIGQYQSIQHPLAHVALHADAARLYTYFAAKAFDSRRKGSDVAQSSSGAKYLASQLAMQAVDAALDTFGGKGFDEDYGVIHLWEAARLLKSVPISNGLILNQWGERALCLPRSY